jgi:hypothetical protein
MELNKDLPAAAVQLDILHKRKALNHEQIIKLAYYKIVSDHAKDGLTLLKDYLPHTPEEKNLKTSLVIQHFMITGQLKNALRYIRDSLHTPETTKEEFPEEPLTSIVAFDNPYYTEARILALTNQDVTAFAMVKELLDSGYAYKNILMNDPAFVRLRKTKKWIKLLNGYSFPEPDEENDRYKKMNENTVIYRIPGSNFNVMNRDEN